VGTDYTVVQNIDWAQLLNTISRQSGSLGVSVPRSHRIRSFVQVTS
jgi:hypothetical protein